MAATPDVRPLRRLAAVLLADVAGYSRLMEQDDAGTHERLRALRRSVIDPAIAAGAGRCVRSKGDDVLVEFASAHDALLAAIRMQRELGEAQRDRPPEAQLRLRIGINLGDLLIDGDDIAGDGVNIAARLQALCAPGDIAISAAVREQLRQPLAGVRIDDAGEFHVRNISRPIHVYRVALAQRRGDRVRSLVNGLRRHARVLATLAVLGGLAMAAPWLLRERGADPAPPLRSIAVLPTVAQATGDAAQALARAVDAQLPGATRQALGPDAMVVTVASDGQRGEIDPATSGRDPSVRFVLNSAVVEAGATIKLAASLTETSTRSQLWSALIEAPSTAASELPAALIARLAAAVEEETRRHELRRTAQAPNADPRVLLLRAQDALANEATTPEKLRAAVGAFAQAGRMNPQLMSAVVGEAEAWTALANVSTDAEEIAQARGQANRLSARAIAHSGSDSEVWRVRALALTANGQHEAAIEAIDRALLLNPFSAESHGQRGLILLAQGRPAQALSSFDTAVHFAPGAATVGAHLYHRARALLLAGRYAEAVDSGMRAIAFVPEWVDYMVLAAAYAMQGKHARAAWAKAELLRLNPGFTIDSILIGSEHLSPVAAAQREEHLFAGLRRAGLR